MCIILLENTEVFIVINYYNGDSINVTQVILKIKIVSLK